MKKPGFFDRRVAVTKANAAIAAAVIVCASLVSAGVTYLFMQNYWEHVLSQAHPIFVPSTPYKLLHPILGIALPADQFSGYFSNVRHDVRSVISSQPAGTIADYAVYFRDLNSGNWTGINENEPFDPASLLKVVVAIAVYRQAENQPSYLSTPLTYTSALAQINSQLPFALPTKLTVGQSYTIPFLMKEALADSDNAAVYTLLDSLDQQGLDEVYRELSIQPPSDASSAGYKLTALEYSRFFRILYNGTLDLSWADSEKIMEDLSQSTFTSGLVAGVPSNVVVAHKYGEHVTGADGVATAVELSDCGIVYYTSRPYFLCVMIRGKDARALADVIAQISKVVYQKEAANP